MTAFWEIAVHSAYDMFSKCKNLIVNLVFTHMGFLSGNFFLIAPPTKDRSVSKPNENLETSATQYLFENGGL